VTDAPLNFSERRKQLLAEKAKQNGVQPKEEFKKEDLLDLGDPGYEVDQELENAIASIGILEAYAKWCGKSKPNPRQGQVESIKVSCPMPGHADKDPSAWINTDKNVWTCGKCEDGGDVYDLAAIHFAYPRPGYKDGETFHKLRIQMAEDFGYVVKKVPGGQIVYKEDPNATQTEQADQQESPVGVVVPLHPEHEEEDELVTYPAIDWRSFVPEDTFLWEYLTACSNDDSPEEYHFWHGLLALGHAAGRNVSLDDNKPVFGNLLVCLLGASGVGKSRSRHWLDHVLSVVLPFQGAGQTPAGVKLVPVPGSGEYLVKAFSFMAQDPVNPKNTWYESVNGIVDFDEMAALMNRANRQGSTLKTTIMGFADTRNEVKIGSLTHKDIIAERPYCSITATTQPRAVRSVLHKGDAGSGFLNRWVFVGGPEKKREVIGGKRSAIGVDLHDAINQLKSVKSWTAKERLIEWDDDAAAKITEFFQTLIYPAQKKDSSDLLKRLDLLFKKLCLLLTINLKRDTVPLAAVNACIQMSEYLINCYGLLEENIGITQQQEIVTDVLRVMRAVEKKQSKGASVRDIQRGLARKNYGPDQLKKALETMVALDMIELEKPKSGQVGRPTIRYREVTA
jgi:hypothetical protein